MKKIRVMVVVGTRPEIIRLSEVIKAFERNPAYDLTLVHTGQNYDYELSEIFFADFKLPNPDYFLNSATGTAIGTIAACIEKIEPVLLEVLPDAFLVLGDTNSCLCAIAAKKHKVPVFHMEAGNRCFDQRVPEELNRKIVDHISDVNLTYSDISREYLLREGVPPQSVIKTGSPMLEVLSKHLTAIENSTILSELKLEKKSYFVVSAHREENIENGESFFRLVGCINAIAEQYQLPIIVSTHPRTRNKINEHAITFNPRVVLIKPLGYFDYNKLQMESRAVLSDSGTISEEASILNLKAVNIRETHERPEAMEEAVALMTGLNTSRILQAIEILDCKQTKLHIKVKDYDVPNVSEKIIGIVCSYIDYINVNTHKKI